MRAKELLKPGDLFEKYRVESLLGHGGMGAVYKVRHVLLDTSFAIKVLFPEIARQNHKFIKRFLREARLAGKIHQQNLIAVYDAGQNSKTGLYYLVMEYIPGGTLRDRLRKEYRLTRSDALGIVTGVAQALEKAFEYKMVHRDIKPDNIMFTEDGTVKLADLGIAKAVGPLDTTLTLEPSVFGTPAYMSPEQARDSHGVDCRADIYSLGIVLYEMLAGQRPYRGENTIEILSQIIDSKEVPDIRKVNSSVNAPLADLLRSMMAKNPEERPQTPTELLERLRAPEILSLTEESSGNPDGGEESSDGTRLSGTCPMFINKIKLVNELASTQAQPQKTLRLQDNDDPSPAQEQAQTIKMQSEASAPVDGHTDHPDFQEAAASRQKKILLYVSSGMILLLSLILLFSFPLLNRKAKNDSSPETTRPLQMQKATTISKPIPETTFPSPAPAEKTTTETPELKTLKSAVILGLRTPANLMLLNSLKKNGNTSSAIFLEAGNFREIRQQLKEIIRKSPKLVVLALSAPFAMRDTSPANFEMLIREVTVQLRDHGIPFAFILDSPNSVPESDRGKLETFNRAVNELAKLQSLNCFDFSSGTISSSQMDSWANSMLQF